MASGRMLAPPRRTTSERMDEANKNAGSSAPTLGDPKSRDPRPPFGIQPQAWPRVASGMEPKPDHGDTGYRGSGRLVGRKALITAGGSGLGRAVAIAYAREGADVAINYPSTEESDAREVIGLIEAAGRKAVALPGDIRDEDYCTALVVDAVRELGGLDIVVSNACRQKSYESISHITSEVLDATMKTNIYAPFWILKAAIPHLRSGATIIATTSEQATDPTSELYDDAMTMAATTNFVRSMSKQLIGKGIRVNGVAPGPIWTPLQAGGGARQEKSKRFDGKTPMGRPAQAAALASIYVQLAVADASDATGRIYGASRAEALT